MELLGIISVSFDITMQPLAIIVFAFIGTAEKRGVRDSTSAIYRLQKAYDSVRREVLLIFS
jgi:hypothetical protein